MCERNMDLNTVCTERDLHTESTAELAASPWPTRVKTHSLLVAPQILAVQSDDAGTTKAPSDENAAD